MANQDYSTCAATSVGATRRDALKGMAFAAAVTAVPASAAASSYGRSEWDRAWAAFDKADAEYCRLWEALEAAEEAVSRACPRNDRLHDEYNLRFHMDRATAARHALSVIALRDGRQSLVLYPAKAREDSLGWWADAKAESERVADEWVAYQAKREKARALSRCDECKRAADAFQPTFFAARDALMAVPAPDNAALLVKIEVANVSLNEDHMEGVLADARRLLSTGRA